MMPLPEYQVNWVIAQYWHSSQAYNNLNARAYGILQVRVMVDIIQQ